jgi:hypothetical protein
MRERCVVVLNQESALHSCTSVTTVGCSSLCSMLQSGYLRSVHRRMLTMSSMSKESPRARLRCPYQLFIEPVEHALLGELAGQGLAVVGGPSSWVKRTRVEPGT